MVVLRAYKTELDLNNVQVSACRRHAGAARYAYNFGLGRKQAEYKATGKSPSAIDLHRELNALKKTDLPWMYEVSKCAPQEALRDLDAAFSHFFRRCRLKKAGTLRGKVGYPKRKTRKKGLGSFRLTGRIRVFPDAIQLPRLGRLRLKERGYLPVDGVKVLSTTVSEQAGHWYVSIQVEQEHEVPGNTGPAVGVDLGIKTLATLSDGSHVPNVKPLKRHLRKLRRLQRTVSRRRKGGQNRRKAVRRLAKQHRAVAHIRAHTLHDLTTRLAKTKSAIVIEDLNVAGMLKNHRLAQAISDVGFGEFRRQLEYKAQWYGSRVIVAPRFYPSSKMCSGCGWIDEHLTLADRTFCCQNPGCGLVIDRDLNAALNLEKLAASSTESRNACGADSAGHAHADVVKLAVLKQEPNTFYPLVE
jgi:putative transposase